MKFRFLYSFEKTGTFLMKVSVFALLAINHVYAQQWDMPSSEETQKNVPFKQNLPAAKSSGHYATMKNVQVKPVVRQYNVYEEEKGHIQLSMKNFKISQNLSGITSCSMDFYIQSTLSTPISNISFRLKWPMLEAPVSFDHVPSNKAVFHTHAFAGKVCYSLDKVPNIIVNRCRVKGMSSQDCASRIEWVK